MKNDFGAEPVTEWTAEMIVSYAAVSLVCEGREPKHDLEPSALRALAEKSVELIDQDCPEYDLANRLPPLPSAQACFELVRSWWQENRTSDNSSVPLVFMFRITGRVNLEVEVLDQTAQLTIAQVSGASSHGL